MTREKQLANLLGRASDEHHQAFSDSHGVDENWATWYSQWLLNHGITKLFDYHINQAKLIYGLMALDIDYTAQKPPITWQDYYASNIDKYLKKETSN